MECELQNKEQKYIIFKADMGRIMGSTSHFLQNSKIGHYNTATFLELLFKITLSQFKQPSEA